MSSPANDDFLQNYPDVDIGDLIEFTLIDPYSEDGRHSPSISGVFLGLDPEGWVALWVLERSRGWKVGLERFSHYAFNSVEIVRKVFVG